MKKTLSKIALASSLVCFSMMAHSAENWSFGGSDEGMSKAEQMKTFDKRKANVIERLEDGKAALIKRMDARIECAKNAKEPREMRACHEAFRLNITEKELLAPIQ